MSKDRIERLYQAVRDIPDFPIPGIVFKDITPILSSAELFKNAIDIFCEACEGMNIDKVVGIDARGFLFGSASAYALGVGFVPVRKKGKLPYKTQSAAYTLEYGQAAVEMHVDAIHPGERVVLIDDLLATGGTSGAAVELIRKLGGELIGAHFLIELEFLQGRRNLPSVEVQSFLKY